jgi:uncharacterized protein (TIGR02145 family)
MKNRIKGVEKYYWFALILMIGISVHLITGCKSCKKEVRETVESVAPAVLTGEVRDIDSNVYRTVTIGKQVWLRENLKVTRFRNGDPISEVTDGFKWSKRKEAAFCNYDNDPIFAVTFGRLYNWHAVNDSRGICPEGYHVPHDGEWFELTVSLDGEGVAGGKLKEEGTNHWSEPNTGATNESGFTALPGGYRGNKGAFQILDDYCFFWTSTSYDDAMAWSRFLQNDDDAVFRIENYKTFGFSVRCVKDR